MEEVKKDTFRSQGKNVCDNDDMIRVVLDVSRREYFKFIKPLLETAHNNKYTATQATPKSCPKCKGTLIGSRPSTGKNHCRLCNHEWA